MPLNPFNREYLKKAAASVISAPFLGWLVVGAMLLAFSATVQNSAFFVRKLTDSRAFLADDEWIYLCASAGLLVATLFARIFHQKIGEWLATYNRALWIFGSCWVLFYSLPYLTASQSLLHLENDISLIFGLASGIVLIGSAIFYWRPSLVPNVVFIVSLGIGICVAGLIAFLVFSLLPTHVPYTGTVGMEIVWQTPQRNEDIAYLTFISFGTVLSFLSWLVLSRHFIVAKNVFNQAPATPTSCALGRWGWGLVIVGLGCFVFQFGPLILSADNNRNMESDFFHTGESYVPVMQTEHGGQPYLDAWPIHGWVVDTFHVKVAEFLGLEKITGSYQVIEAFGFIGLLIIFFVMAKYTSIGIFASAFLCLLLLLRHTNFQQIASPLYRVIPFFIIFPLLLYVSREGRHVRRFLLCTLAGLIAGLGLFFSQDTGYTLILGVTAFSALWFLFYLRGHHTTLIPSIATLFGLGIGICIFAGWIYFDSGLQGTYQVFMTFINVLKGKSHQDSMPFSGERIDYFELPLLVIILSTVYLINFVNFHQRREYDPWRIIWPVIILVAVVWYKKFLDRNDSWHICDVQPISALLAAALWGWLKEKNNTFLIKALIVLLVLLNVNPLEECLPALRSWKSTGLAEDLKGKELITWPLKTPFDIQVTHGWMESYYPILSELETRLKPNETFYDMANSGLSNVYLDKLPPTRFSQQLHVMTEDMQEMVIQELASKRPSMAIWRNRVHIPPWDDVHDELRVSLISTWLLSHMHPVWRHEKSGLLLASPASPSGSPEEGNTIFRDVLPPTRFAQTGIQQYGFFMGALAREWGDVPPFWLTRRNAFVNTQDVAISGPYLRIEHPRDYAALRLRIHATAQHESAIFWGNGYPDQAIFFLVYPGTFDYHLPLSSMAGYVWAGAPVRLFIPDGTQKATLVLLPKDLRGDSYSPVNIVEE